MPENALSMSVKHVHEPLPAEKLVREHNVPMPIVQIIVKMTAKKPHERYQSASELVDVLSDALAIIGSGSLSNQSNTPLPARQTYDLPPQAPLICFRCGEPNARTHRHCIICGDDLANKGASADRYLAPNGRPILARLLMQTGTMEGRAFRFHQSITTIGRLAGNDFIIIGPTVSRRHAQLNFSEGRWYIEDLKSGNGTQVNGQRVYGHTLLKDGDIINFGDERAIFTMVTDG